MQKESNENQGQGHDKAYVISVNTRDQNWSEKEISFDQVVILAYGAISNDPKVIYTITYKRGHGDKPEGSMVKGEVVKVKNEMRFNVSESNQS